VGGGDEHGRNDQATSATDRGPGAKVKAARARELAAPDKRKGTVQELEQSEMLERNRELDVKQVRPRQGRAK